MNKDKVTERNKQQSALFDLQDFLEKEVEDASPGAFYRSFTPLTEGLGLESPKTQPKVESPRPTSPTIKKPAISHFFDEPAHMEDKKETATSGVSVNDILESLSPNTFSSEPTLKSVIDSEVSEPRKSETQPESVVIKMPPKLPKVTVTRRLLAMLVDQLFVLTVWATALVLTSNALNGFQSGFTFDLFKDFSQSPFQRFAVLEFAAIWVGYLAVCLGIMDLTFGMWVWGLRVSYGEPEESQYWMRKMMRVVWSFFFFAPILPAFLLIIRRKGRNLLDVLSGTNLYVAG